MLELDFYQIFYLISNKSVDMELTPSFKVKVLKEWGDLHGHYYLCIDRGVRIINRDCRFASMERERVSNTNILICGLSYQYSYNDIFTKQSSGTDVANPRICSVTCISSCGRAINK